jgi:hypothetical protein
MKVFRIEVDITSTAWETANAYVEAETLEEALVLFKANPHNYDWDNWETHDSETQHWEIDEENCKYDEHMTKYLAGKEETSLRLVNRKNYEKICSKGNENV